MNEAFFAIATIAALVVGQGQAQEPTTGPCREVPELAALSGFVGKWDCRSQLKPLEGVTEGGTRTGTAEAEWIHGGRFLRQTWTIEPAGTEPGLSGSAIMTYDPAKKAYRSWHFISNGGTRESPGTYDEKTKTMTWTARDANGIHIVTKSTFAEDGSENWTITVTDAKGKVVEDMKGKNTRRKK
jgi:hypothetical protein